MKPFSGSERSLNDLPVPYPYPQWFACPGSGSTLICMSRIHIDLPIPDPYPLWFACPGSGSPLEIHIRYCQKMCTHFYTNLSLAFQRSFLLVPGTLGNKREKKVLKKRKEGEKSLGRIRIRRRIEVNCGLKHWVIEPTMTPGHKTRYVFPAN